jgi:hypothetical protein
MKPSVRNIALAAALGILVLALGVIDFTTDLGTDYGGYFSHGWFITRGLSPYADFWTHKTPLLPLVLAGWIAAFGRGFYTAALFPLAVAGLTSMIVLPFARALDVRPRVAAAAAVLFAFLSASHVIDPTRNGVIVFAAAAFEMLAMIAVIHGVRTNRVSYLASSGVFIALAFATRQTAIIVCLPVAVAIVAIRRRANFGRAARDITIVAVCSLFTIGPMTAGLMARGVTLSTLLDQVYRFNLAYSAGHHMKLTWWVSEWAQTIWSSGTLAVVVCTAWFAWRQVAAIRRSATVPSEIILASLVVAHAIAIYAAHKVQVMYLGQMLPELCVIAALAGSAAADRANIRLGLSRRLAIVAAVAVIIAWPVGIEARIVSDRISRARDGGFLFNVRNLPSQARARRLQSLTQLGDRVWVFSANADAVYPFSNRLPAIRMTSVAGLVYPTPNDFDDWRADFQMHPPRAVVGFYGGEFLQKYSADPRGSDGQSMATIVQIERFLVVNMRLVGPPGERPEYFVWPQ